MHDGIRTALHGRRIALSAAVVVGLLTSACGSSSLPVARTYTLGHFPDVPTGSFSQSTVSALQADLNAAINPGGLPGKRGRCAPV
jgi:S1-C subfamily serine protease